MSFQIWFDFCGLRGITFMNDLFSSPTVTKNSVECFKFLSNRLSYYHYGTKERLESGKKWTKKIISIKKLPVQSQYSKQQIDAFNMLTVNYRDTATTSVYIFLLPLLLPLNTFCIPAATHLFKVNGNTRTICEIFSKLTIKTPE